MLLCSTIFWTLPAWTHLSIYWHLLSWWLSNKTPLDKLLPLQYGSVAHHQNCHLFCTMCHVTCPDPWVQQIPGIEMAFSAYHCNNGIGREDTDWQNRRKTLFPCICQEKKTKTKKLPRDYVGSEYKL